VIKLKEIELIKTVFEKKDLLFDKRSKIVFAGRSNVGKSTLINTMLNRKKLAKTSSTPGKTRSINYYLINKKFFFVDLPGYGFAKVSKREKKKWEDLLKEFFSFEKYVILLSLIVDVKVGITEYDLKMLSTAAYFRLPTLIILNKIDKVKKSMIKEISENIENELDIPVLPFSSKDGRGKRELWITIEKTLQEWKNGNKEN